jgi:short-subunit dehydrogenase
MNMPSTLITGASRGLGKALACEFSKKGYGLVLNSHNGISVLPEHRTVVGDIVKETTRYKLAVAAKAIDLDILINNVGIYDNALFTEMNPDMINRMLRINLIAPMLLTQMILPIFQKNKSGLIVNINSTAGKHGMAKESVYCAGKHGLRGFSQALGQEVAKDGIKILDVFPGAMKTDMTKNRPDWENLMEPSEVAMAIFDACKNYPTMKITELYIGRTNYGK